MATYHSRELGQRSERNYLAAGRTKAGSWFDSREGKKIKSPPKDIDHTASLARGTELFPLR
jgi:hypothetical protein